MDLKKYFRPSTPLLDVTVPGKVLGDLEYALKKVDGPSLFVDVRDSLLAGVSSSEHQILWEIMSCVKKGDFVNPVRTRLYDYYNVPGIGHFGVFPSGLVHDVVQTLSKRGIVPFLVNLSTDFEKIEKFQDRGEEYRSVGSVFFTKPDKLDHPYSEYIYMHRIIPGAHAPTLKAISALHKNLREPGGPRWTYPHPLREYQGPAVGAALAGRRGVWSLPTGSGKNVTAALLFEATRLPGFVLVRTREAVDAAYKDLTSALGGVKIGRWGAGRKETGWITVCTYRALTGCVISVPDGDGARRERREPDADLLALFLASPVIVVDECHHVAGLLRELLESSSAPFKIGMSGTPGRGDGMTLLTTAALGPVLIERKVVALERAGVIASGRTVVVPSAPPDGFAVADWTRLTAEDRYRSAVVNNRPRNMAAARIVRASSRRLWIVVTDRVDHARIMADMLSVPLVHGSVPPAERVAAAEDLAAGKIPGVVVTTVWDESVNIKSIKLVVDLTGYSPDNVGAQRRGRASRIQDATAGGDPERLSSSLYVVFMDGWAEDLTEHSERRERLLTRAGFKPERIELEELLKQIALEEANHCA